MKRAEEWKADTSSHGTAYIHINDIRAIQLDAMKEGARRAANECIVLQNSTGNLLLRMGYGTASASVLTAAEQWTEKDL